MVDTGNEASDCNQRRFPYCVNMRSVNNLSISGLDFYRVLCYSDFYIFDEEVMNAWTMVQMMNVIIVYIL